MPIPPDAVQLLYDMSFISGTNVQDVVSTALGCFELIVTHYLAGKPCQMTPHSYNGVRIPVEIVIKKFGDNYGTDIAFPEESKRRVQELATELNITTSEFVRRALGDYHYLLVNAKDLDGRLFSRDELKELFIGHTP